PILPDATHYFTPLIFTLSVVAVIYVSLVALMQEDMKRLIAYSSVAHMGFVTIGIFTFTVQGIEGGLVQMLSHGIISGALFLIVGVIYDRIHTRAIDRYGGLVHRMPVYAALFMLFTLANVGLPGTSGFVGEVLILIGVFQVNTWVAFLAAIGIVLSAAYALWLYRRVMFGALVKDELKEIVDMNRREVLVFAPLVVIVLWMGLYPVPFLEVMHVSVANLIEQHELALAAGQGLELAAR
ncbi:MAG: NADH-quinone oxidoreductase subunit M, partial [Alphaproteobacteria bacterium]